MESMSFRFIIPGRDCELVNYGSDRGPKAWFPKLKSIPDSRGEFSASERQDLHEIELRIDLR